MVDLFVGIAQSRRCQTADDLSAPFTQQNTNQCLSVTCRMKSDFTIKANCVNKHFLSLWVSGEKSFHPHQIESHSVINGLNSSVHLQFLSAEGIFGSPMWQAGWCTEKSERGGRERVMAVTGRESLTEFPPAGSVWDLGPWGSLDGSCWMGALARWPGSLKTGYRGKGMLLLCVWPPDPLSNVWLGSFETQHIYLQCSEERGWSSCQNKVIFLLTASSAVEGQWRQAHNVAASASHGRRTVICGHESHSHLPSLNLPQFARIISLAQLGMFFISVYKRGIWVTCGNFLFLGLSIFCSFYHHERERETERAEM